MASNRKVRQAQRLLTELKKDLNNYGICVVNEQGERVPIEEMEVDKENNLIIPANYKALVLK